MMNRQDVRLQTVSGKLAFCRIFLPIFDSDQFPLLHTATQVDGKVHYPFIIFINSSTAVGGSSR